MSNIYTSAEQLIGKTPLMELTHLEEKYQLKAKLLAKLEGFNPAGSVKDRVALAKQPENQGKTIVALLPDTGDRYLSTPMFQG